MKKKQPLLLHNITLVSYIIVLIIAISFPTHTSCRDNASSADTIQKIASVKGADMTIYELYRQHINNRDLAMQYLETFLEGIDSTDANQTVAGLYEKMSDYCGYYTFIYSKSIRYLSRAIDIYKSHGNTFRIAVAKYNMAKLLLNTDQYDKSLIYSTEALDTFRKVRNIEYTLECYNLLGILYYVCEDYQVSNDYFRKYAEGARQLKDSVKLMLAINNSSLYTSNITNDTTKTRQLLRESIRMARGIRDSSYMFSMYFNLINSYMAYGQTQDALRLLDLCDDVARNIKEKGKLAYIRGAYSMSTNNYGEAIRHFRASIDYFRKGELGKEQKKSLLALQHAYKSMGQYREAHEALIDYYVIDQKTTKSTYIKMFKAQNEIMAQKKQEEINLMRERQGRNRTIAISVIIIALIITYFYFRKKRILISKKEMELDNIRLTQEKAEQEIRSQAEIVEIKKMQQYQIDRIVENTILKMEEIARKIDDRDIRHEIKDICNNIRSSRDDSQWEEINHYIPEFNTVFYKKLIADFPDLTINERRLCALLNLNMTTKEISKITKQSAHSINIARGRLRSKLGLTGSTETIQHFLSKYSQYTNI